MNKRRSGILLHPTSLPGNYGIGDIGNNAYSFIQVLSELGISIWQMLPLGPTGAGNSPYTAFSAFAGNELLISPELLAEEGFLKNEDIASIESMNPEKVDYSKVGLYKNELLQKAFHRFQGNPAQSIRPVFSRLPLKGKKETEEKPNTIEKDFENFQMQIEIKYWLQDYANFRAIKDHFQNISWLDWPVPFRDRDSETIKSWQKQNKENIEKHKFIQYLFFRQWHLLKKRANDSGIIIFGDMPIFVSLDSADVWVNRDIFLLNSTGRPKVVAGVPPDYFSSTGQLWGNPLYDWKVLKRNQYNWWIERFKTIRTLVDLVRIDHFRGFVSYWEVPEGEKTAINGKWKKGPGADFFRSLKKILGEFPIVAEDLGEISPEMEKLRDDMGFPGMKILHFAFGGGADNFYLPHNHIPESVVYTGTHDNDTTVGWYNSSPEHVKKHVRDYMGMDDSGIVFKLMRMAFTSVAKIAILPMQDILEKDSSNRMNTPSVADGNWQWRMQWPDLTQERKNFIKEINFLSGRN